MRTNTNTDVNLTSTDDKTAREYHVTHTSAHGDVYGHEIRHCDPCGCNGREIFLGTQEQFSSVGYETIERGDRVEA